MIGSSRDNCTIRGLGRCNSLIKVNVYYQTRKFRKKSLIAMNKEGACYIRRQ